MTCVIRQIVYQHTFLRRKGEKEHSWVTTPLLQHHSGGKWDYSQCMCVKWSTCVNLCRMRAFDFNEVTGINLGPEPALCKCAEELCLLESCNTASQSGSKRKGTRGPVNHPLIFAISFTAVTTVKQTQKTTRQLEIMFEVWGMEA